jgi:hypothetical protein
MTLIVANTSFSYGNGVFQEGVTYNTAGPDPNVTIANAAHPELFYSATVSKTANTSFVTTASGIQRTVRVGEQLPAADPAVTQCPAFFT